jgi:hypothetical protein
MTGTRLRLLLGLAACCLFTACGDLLSTTVTFTGWVHLSDDPPEGHGGVMVSTGSVSTWTDAGGWFSLSGEVVYDANVTLTFSKDGYSPSTVQRYIEPISAPRTIDLGKVEVTTYQSPELHITVSGERSDSGTVTNFTYQFDYDVNLTSLNITFPGYAPVTEPDALGDKTAGTTYYSDGWNAGGGQMPTGDHFLNFRGTWSGREFSVDVTEYIN